MMSLTKTTKITQVLGTGEKGDERRVETKLGGKPSDRVAASSQLFAQSVCQCLGLLASSTHGLV